MGAPTGQLLGPVYQVAQPGLRMLQNEAPRFPRYYEKVLLGACLITMPLSVVVAVYSTEITRGLLGGKWMESAPILMVLSFGTFIKQPVGSSAFILVARGKSKVYLGLTALNNATFIVAMLIGVHWG